MCLLVVVGATCQIKLGTLSSQGAAFLRHYGPETESHDRYTCSHSGVVVRTAAANLLSSTRRTTPVHRHLFLIALLLVGIKVNPGPVKQINNSKNNSIKKVTVGTLNAHSIVNKAADFHLTVEEENLDVVAITETWVPSDTPMPSVKISFHQGISSSMLLTRIVVVAGVWLSSTVSI